MLSASGVPCIRTKEPGGTLIGQQLRQMILNPEQPFQHTHTEVYLFYADRLEHLETVIKPALLDGKVILCDRYIDSTYAYQVGGRYIPISMIESLNQMTQVVLPDLTILLDLDPQEGIHRIQARSPMDRFEKEDISFHHRVRDTYLRLALRFSSRIHKIEVQSLSEDQVFEQIHKTVLGVLRKNSIV
jgi:dTMP kinase